MKFEKWNKQFYIEPQDVLNESEITTEDMQKELGEDYAKALRYNYSRRIYRYIFQKARSSDEKSTQAIKKIIHQSKTKQHYLKEAIIEYLRAVLTYGRDMEDYDPNGKEAVPENVATILREGGLFIRGEIQTTMEQIEKYWADNLED